MLSLFSIAVLWSICCFDTWMGFHWMASILLPLFFFFRSRVWTSMCLRTSDNITNAFPHSEHLCGRSPVWIAELETSGWQFRAGFGFKPRPHRVSMRTSRLSRHGVAIHYFITENIFSHCDSIIYFTFLPSGQNHNIAIETWRMHRVVLLSTLRNGSGVGCYTGNGRITCMIKLDVD